MTDDLAGRKCGHEYPVNGVLTNFPDRVFTGREALTRSGHTPASEFQLILVRDQRTHLILTDDDIDAIEQAGGELRAFRSDGTCAFTVDEVGQVWGDEGMEVGEFLRHWPPPEGHHWEIERDDEPDTVLEGGGVLSFGPEGVEHIVSKKDKHRDMVLVMVVTTAGVYPAEGSKRYPAKTMISSVLEDAARKLKITAVPDWVVQIGGNDVLATQTFEQLGLTGSVTIEWGAREGGGGA